MKCNQTTGERKKGDIPVNPTIKGFCFVVFSAASVWQDDHFHHVYGGKNSSQVSLRVNHSLEKMWSVTYSRLDWEIKRELEFALIDPDAKQDS